jgi:adenosine kinase
LKANWEVITSAQYYYVTGFFLAVSPDSVHSIAQHCVENGKTMLINLSAEFVARDNAIREQVCVLFEIVK